MTDSSDIKVEELVEQAQAFVDRKYVAHADERQRAMGLAYVEAERRNLAKAIAHFTAAALSQMHRDYLAKLAEEHRQTADMAEALAKCQRERDEDRQTFHDNQWRQLQEAERLLASQADEIRRKDEALRLAVEYDDILLRFKGPAVIFDGDVPEIDAAYDKWVSAARAALLPEGKQQEVGR